MKIVTAGQRGIVATGDEIRKKRHNKRRLFSYSLTLLFSICVLGAAQGAKLCIKYIPNTQGKSYAWGDGNTWTIGDGCGNAYKTGSPYTFCNSFTAIGVLHYKGNVCNCLMLWPYVGIIGLDFMSESECYTTDRTRTCGFHITGSNIANYNGLKQPYPELIP